MKFKNILCKWVSAVLVLASMCCIFSGCGKKSGGADDTIVIFAPTLIVKEDENRRAEYQRIIKEATGCNVDFITTPISGFEQKLGILMNSGEQIDIIWTTGVASMVNMVNQQLLMPIDDYVANSTYLNSDEYLARDAIDTTMIENNIYGVPYKMPMGYVPVINKAWLDQLGLDVPETFEELNDALYAFVENDLGGGLTIGTTHQYPYTEVIASYLGFFGVKGGHVTKDEQGRRYHPFLTENAKQGLQWMQDLYRDGILDKEFPTIQESVMRQKLSNGNVGFTFDWPGSSEQMNERAADNGKSDNVNMVAMEPVSAIEGVEAYIPGHTTVSWAISSTTENPDMAFKVVEYLCTAEAVGALGMQEGLDYEVKNGKEVVLSTATGIVVQESALSPIRDLQTGIQSTEETVREMQILNNHRCHLTWERETSETDIITSKNLLKCITGKMSVEEYQQKLKEELMKFHYIDYSEI